MGNTRLDKWRSQKDALDARIRREEAKTRAKDRKTDTRRKILGGAVAFEWAETDATFNAAFKAQLDKRLIRPDDRALFGLAPLPVATEEAGNDAGAKGDTSVAA